MIRFFFTKSPLVAAQIRYRDPQGVLSIQSIASGQFTGQEKVKIKLDFISGLGVHEWGKRQLHPERCRSGYYTVFV